MERTKIHFRGMRWPGEPVLSVEHPTNISWKEIAKILIRRLWAASTELSRCNFSPIKGTLAIIASSTFPMRV